jgi:transposase
MTALLPDRVWNEIEPFLPQHRRSSKGGRPRIDDRKALTGIIFILRTGIPWQTLPLEMGCGSGSTCWRRMEEWTDAGVWPHVLEHLLRALGKAGKIDLSRAVIDSASVRAVFGGRTPAQTRRIAGKTAAKGTFLRTLTESLWLSKQVRPTSGTKNGSCRC